jgi:hypothetical protein
MILFKKRKTEMRYRKIIFAAALTGASLIAATAWAAFKTPWDGEWVGTTKKGDAVDVTISGASVSGYQFKGQGVTVNSSTVAPKTVVFHVGYLNGEIRVTRTGESTASYTYSASDGGHAAGKLTRR